MHFYNLLEVKVQYTPGCYYGMKLCGIIWKLWYYGMEVVVFIQFSLYGTYLSKTVCMEHNLSKPDYMEVLLLLLQIVSK